jgi:hypothetical protein
LAICHTDRPHLYLKQKAEGPWHEADLRKILPVLRPLFFVFKKEQETNMNALKKSTPLFIGAVVFVAAFLHDSPLYPSLMIGALLAWISFAIIRTPFVTQKIARLSGKIDQAEPPVPPDTPASWAAAQRQLEQRITDQLQDLSPDIEWQWETTCTQALLEKGGSAHIVLKHLEDYPRAEITLDEEGHLSIRCVNMVALKELAEKTPPLPRPKPRSAPTPKKQKAEPKSVNVQAWFELIGNDALRHIITELTTRDCYSMFITENGDVLTVENGTPVQQPQPLKQFPAKAHWPELQELLRKSGVEASIDNGQMQLSWA